MKLRSRSVWLPAVTLLATGCITGAALSLGDDARATITTARPGAWMASDRAGSVSHLGPDGVDATVELERATGGLHVVQVDGVAYVTDDGGRLSRIDPAQLEVAQEATLPTSTAKLVAGGGRLYAVDMTTGVVRQLDPVQLTAVGPPLVTDARPGSAVVDDKGVLWVSDLATGKVIAIDGATVAPTSPKVADPGDDVRLSVVGDDVVAVNTKTATATVVSDPKAPTAKVPTAAAGTALDVPEAVEAGQVLPIVTGPRTLTLLHVRRGESRAVELPVTGHRLGTPRVSGSRVYLPDYTDGSVIVIDIDTARVVDTVTVTGKPGPFEVLVDGSTVYVNDPTSEHAWTITPDGKAVAADKYDPNSPRGGGAVRSAVPPAPTTPTTVPDGGSDAPEPPTTTPSTTPRSTTSTTVRERDRDRTTTTTAREDEGEGSPPATPPTTRSNGPDDRGNGNSGNNGNGNGGSSGSSGSGTTGTIVVGTGGTVGTTPTPTGDGAVTGFVASAGDGAATLAWTAPAGWRTVTGYVIVVKPGGANPPTGTTLTITDPAATSFTVRPLDNGRPYTFGIRAQSAEGPGPSITSNRVVPSRAAPAAPRNVAVNPGDGQVTIGWEAPVGAPVDGYAVVVLDARGAQVGNATTGASTPTATISGLPNGVELHATVAATVDDNGSTVAGTAAPSPVFVTKGRPGVPGSPRLALVGGGDAVRVTWMAAASNGSPITSYLVTADPQSGYGGGQPPPTIDVPAAADATETTVSNLYVGVTYAVTVTAVNAFGSARAAAGPITATTGGEAPTAPGNVQATAGYHAATITWTPSTAARTLVANYLVRNLNDNTTRTVPGQASSSYTWDALTPGVTYRFDVAALATSGNTVSATSASVVPLGTTAPGAITSALVSDTSVSLSFAQPAPVGPAFTSWEVTTVPDSGGVHTFPYTVGPALLQIDGLALSTTYRFDVVAVDAAGGRSAPTSATATTGAGGPAAPTNFRHTVTTNTKTGILRFTFSWDAVPGATSYTFDSGSGVVAANITTTTRSVSVYGDDTMYTATVVAHNANGTSTVVTNNYFAGYVGCNGCIPP